MPKWSIFFYGIYRNAHSICHVHLQDLSAHALCPQSMHQAFEVIPRILWEDLRNWSLSVKINFKIIVPAQSTVDAVDALFVACTLLATFPRYIYWKYANMVSAIVRKWQLNIYFVASSISHTICIILIEDFVLCCIKSCGSDYYVWLYRFAFHHVNST